MANTLNSRELEHYHSEGYVFPRRVMPEKEAAGRSWRSTMPVPWETLRRTVSLSSRRSGTNPRA